MYCAAFLFCCMQHALWSDLFTGRLKTEIPDALVWFCKFYLFSLSATCNICMWCLCYAVCTSILLTLTLVHYDLTVRQKVKIGTWQYRSVSWLPACWKFKTDPDHNNLWFQVIQMKTSVVFKRCGVLHFSSNNVGISASCCESKKNRVWTVHEKMDRTQYSIFRTQYRQTQNLVRFTQVLTRSPANVV